jgi:hypothetical protein
MILLDQNSSPGITIILASGGEPVTGLDHTDVVSFLSKNGSPAASFSLTAGNFTELSAANLPGLYHVNFTSAQTDSVGELVVLFRDVTETGIFDQYAIRASVYNRTFDGLAGLSTDNANMVIDAVEINEGKIDAVNSNVSTINTDLNAIKGTGFVSGTNSLKAQSDLFQDRVTGEVALKEQLVGAGGTENAPAGLGIWDVLGDGSVTMGDLNLSMRRILGLVHENFAIFNQGYDAVNNLISATVRIYDTKTDTEANTNHIAEYTVSATYDSSNRLTNYTMVREP